MFLPNSEYLNKGSQVYNCIFKYILWGNVLHVPLSLHNSRTYFILINSLLFSLQNTIFGITHLNNNSFNLFIIAIVCTHCMYLRRGAGQSVKTNFWKKYLPIIKKIIVLASLDAQYTHFYFEKKKIPYSPSKNNSAHMDCKKRICLWCVQPSPQISNGLPLMNKQIFQDFNMPGPKCVSWPVFIV